MFQNTTSTFALNFTRVAHVILMVSAALILLGIVPSCQTAPLRSDRQQGVSAPKASTQSLAPGQRVEAVIVEPAGKIKSRRVRGVISKKHLLMLPTLGTFDTQHKTAAELEQEVLASFNQGNNLKGTVRLNAVTLETTGLFVMASEETTRTILSDPIQKQLLDQGNHTLWQWVSVDESLTNFPLQHTDGDSENKNADAIIAQPAHLILTGQTLHENVIEAHVSLNPVNQFRNLTVRLSPAAGTSLNKLGQTHLEQPLLIVSGGVCIYTAAITPFMGEILVITSGRTSFTDEQIKDLQAVFVDEE